MSADIDRIERRREYLRTLCALADDLDRIAGHPTNLGHRMREVAIERADSILEDQMRTILTVFDPTMSSKPVRPN